VDGSIGTLRLYGQPSDKPALDWSWVSHELAGAGTYWVGGPGGRYPHPRPVWGVWHQEQLHLSIGSPTISRGVVPGSGVTVHLDSGTDVVIVEGDVVGSSTDADVIASYNRKYDWNYEVDQYGPLTHVAPVVVMAWRSAGWAGRDGFQQTGRWTGPTRGT
jgi:hypothetical protein